MRIAPRVVTLPLVASLLFACAGSELQPKNVDAPTTVDLSAEQPQQAAGEEAPFAATDDNPSGALAGLHGDLVGGAALLNGDDSLGTLGTSRDRADNQAVIGKSASQSTGSLPKELIQRVVRQSMPKLRSCYEKALKNDPTLSGKVSVKFTIAPTGDVSSAKSEGDLAAPEVMRCVEKTFVSMTFPKPDGGIVVVSYPIVFAADNAN